MPELTRQRAELFEDMLSKRPLSALEEWLRPNTALSSSTACIYTRLLSRARRLSSPKTPSIFQTSNTHSDSAFHDMTDEEAVSIVAMQNLARPETWRCVPESAGNTYLFPVLDERNAIRWIGTAGCYTCVGVYFAIDARRCFVGHFNFDYAYDAATYHPNNPDDGRDLSDYHCNHPEAFRYFRDLVEAKLTELQQKHGWGPVTDLMRRSVRMICPLASQTSTTWTGDAIVEGVNAFLGTLSGRRRPKECNGFMVFHTGTASPPVEYFTDSDPNHREEDWQRRNHRANDFCGSAEIERNGALATTPRQYGPNQPVAER